MGDMHIFWIVHGDTFPSLLCAKPLCHWYYPELVFSGKDWIHGFQSCSKKLIFWSRKRTWRCTWMLPFPKMELLRFRVAKWLVQGHTASQCWNPEEKSASWLLAPTSHMSGRGLFATFLHLCKLLLCIKDQLYLWGSWQGGGGKEERRDIFKRKTLMVEKIRHCDFRVTFWKLEGRKLSHPMR